RIKMRARAFVIGFCWAVNNSLKASVSIATASGLAGRKSHLIKTKRITRHKSRSFLSLKNLIVSFRSSGTVPRKNSFGTTIGFYGICESIRRARQSSTQNSQSLQNAPQEVPGHRRRKDNAL